VKARFGPEPLVKRRKSLTKPQRGGRIRIAQSMWLSWYRWWRDQRLQELIDLFALFLG
jgi:hypothetical protein